jgi:importin-7
MNFTPLKTLTFEPRLTTTFLTAVVYLKNRVTRGWETRDGFGQNTPIAEEEKPAVRERLVPILASSTPPVRQQLVPLIQKILHYDFPDKWPNFMDITLQLMNTNDANSVFAGLQCLLAICKVYRFKANETRADFDKIVGLLFPQLLNIGNSLVEETSNEAGEMLKIVMKAYKNAIYVSILKCILRHVQSLTMFSSSFQHIFGSSRPSSAGARYSCELLRRMRHRMLSMKILKKERSIPGGSRRSGHTRI